MRRLKTIVSALMVAFVVIVSLDYAASASTGHSFILGKANKANKMTTLKRTTSGSALKLKTTSSSAAPMVVNGTGKVAYLNADKVDGYDSVDLGMRAYAAVGANGNLNPSDGDGPIGGSSFGVTQSNLTTHSVTGTYCFHPSFTPKSAQVSAIGDLGNASSFFTVATVSVRTAHGLSGCGSNDSVRVRTYTIPADPGSPSLTDEPFILWIK